MCRVYRVLYFNFLIHRLSMFCRLASKSPWIGKVSLVITSWRIRLGAWVGRTHLTWVRLESFPYQYPSSLKKKKEKEVRNHFWQCFSQYQPSNVLKRQNLHMWISYPFKNHILHTVWRVLSFREGEVGSREDQQIPEDGHTWKKYGQKLIRSINKIRWMHLF